jgi:hypothetical protein
LQKLKEESKQQITVTNEGESVEILQKKGFSNNEKWKPLLSEIAIEENPTQVEQEYYQLGQARKDVEYTYEELELQLDGNTNSSSKRSLDLNEILGIRIFDEYIAVIHAIIEGKKRILRCQICSSPIVKI